MPNKSSADYLGSLYTVIVALALTRAITSIIDVDNLMVTLTFESLLGVLTLLITVVPFYHGALRHLDITYGSSSRIPSGLVLWDFSMLFLEACILLAASVLVQQPYRLAVALTILWMTDILWVSISHLLGPSPEIEWAKVNVIAVIVMMGLILLDSLTAFRPVSVMVVFLVALLRTLLDYSRSWSFYFPRDFQSNEVS